MQSLQRSKKYLFLHEESLNWIWVHLRMQKIIGISRNDFQAYCLSNKSSPIFYSKLLYKFGQDFLDIQRCLGKHRVTTFSLDLPFKNASLRALERASIRGNPKYSS